ncbi:MAG: hypothetical protein K5657_10310 [Desulfovibrio sp.]|nr:hypothetical protein [Desulfovibrio sp.]
MLKLTDQQRKFLLSTAHLVWWKSSEETLEDIPFLLRQIMTMGNLQQSEIMEKLFSKKCLLSALRDAKAGQMTPRAWHFWHYRLTDCRLGEIPPMPVRNFSQGEY